MIKKLDKFDNFMFENAMQIALFLVFSSIILSNFNLSAKLVSIAIIILIYGVLCAVVKDGGF